MSKDAWIKRLEDEVKQLAQQAKSIRDQRASLQRKRYWLNARYRYGTMLCEEGLGRRERIYVVVEAKDRHVVAREAKEKDDWKDSKLALTDIEHSFWEIELGLSEPEVVGHYTGPDLPPKPPEAEWAEKVLDGKVKMCLVCKEDYCHELGVYCKCVGPPIPVQCRFCGREADVTWDAQSCETGGHICSDCLSTEKISCANCGKPTDPRGEYCYYCLDSIECDDL